MLMDKQAKITPKRGMPIERTDESQKIVSIT